MFDGPVSKLVILSFEDEDAYQSELPAEAVFVAQFNPEAYTLNTELELGPEEPAPGDDGEEAKFKTIKPRTLSFDFTLDGSGATGEKVDVADRLDNFKQTVGFSGKIHRPKFLVLSWADLVFTCALETFSVNYKLFKADGTPLRAVLSATFKEHKPKELREKTKNLSSPDLTHLYAVKNKEHLALLSHKIYKDPNYYYQVALANKLDNLRQLTVGEKILFPPIKK